MKEKEKQLIFAYIYNNRCRLEEQLNNMQSNIRFRKIDICDCMEFICAKQEYETFIEVTDHIRTLLKLGVDQNVKAVKKKI